VDDDESLVESLRRTLSKAGYPVTKRTSPAAALHGPPVTGLTVLVTDLDMPGMDGIELSRQM
jgi:FixJ family two-component response regulator